MKTPIPNLKPRLKTSILILVTLIFHLARADFENKCAGATVHASWFAVNKEGVNDGLINWRFICANPSADNCAQTEVGSEGWAWITLELPDDGEWLSTIVYHIAGD